MAKQPFLDSTTDVTIDLSMSESSVIIPSCGAPATAAANDFHETSIIARKLASEF